MAVKILLVGVVGGKYVVLSYKGVAQYLCGTHKK
jgi:hypothetical protein